ncbi:MAG: hypothetical protein HFG75_10185 [Hungatella sp.]|nr:hypothetical protein [Hungatella sp.]
MKKLKKKIFLIKAKIFLLFVLPFAIVLLAIKTLETFLRQNLRQAASSMPHERPDIRPVSQTSFHPEIVPARPVSLK